MTRFLDDFEQRRWADDVAAHARAVNLLAQAKTPELRQYLEDRIAIIEFRHPRHFKRRAFPAQPAQPTEPRNG